MKYAFTQILLFVLSVLFLYYFISQKYFVPETSSGTLNWVNISIFTLLSFLCLEGAIGAIVTLGKKILFFREVPEWPSIKSSLKWSLLVPLLLVIVFILNIFHLLTLPWGIAVGIVIIATVLLLK